MSEAGDEDAALRTQQHGRGSPVGAISKDVFIMVKHDSVIVTYLTDKTSRLRAAAIFDHGGARLITNEKATAKFKAEPMQFAKEAAKLLPTR